MIGIVILFNKLGRVYKEEPDNMMKEVLAHQPEQVPLPDPAIVSIISSFFSDRDLGPWELVGSIESSSCEMERPTVRRVRHSKEGGEQARQHLCKLLLLQASRGLAYQLDGSLQACLALAMAPCQ